MPPSSGDYIATKTVGSGKNYTTIGAAVDYWWTQFEHLGSLSRGKILIDAGNYAEMLCNDAGDYTSSYNGGTGKLLPPYVDLIGSGGKAVITKIPPVSHENAGMVRCVGNNYFEAMKMESAAGSYVSKSIISVGSGSLADLECDDVHIFGLHGGIHCGDDGDLVANDLTVTTKYGPGIRCADLQLTGTNAITVYAQNNNAQLPGGLLCKSGNAANITISCTQDVGDNAAGWIVYGVRTVGVSGDLLVLDNLAVNMTVNNIEVASGLWGYLSGIHNGPVWTTAADTSAVCDVILRDSSIALVATEAAAGKGLKVAGVRVRGGGTVFVQNSTIATSNDNGSGEAESEDYDLKRENGALRINQANTIYGKARTNGTIEKLNFMVA